MGPNIISWASDGYCLTLDLSYLVEPVDIIGHDIYYLTCRGLSQSRII